MRAFYPGFSYVGGDNYTGIKYSERIFYEGILYLESSLYIGKNNSDSIFKNRYAIPREECHDWLSLRRWHALFRK